MTPALIALSHAWDHALDSGILTAGILESLQMDGMAEIVIAMAADEAGDAGPRALMCAAILGQLPGARPQFEDLVGAAAETERHLSAIYGIGLTPTRRMDHLRALTTQRGHLSPEAGEVAARVHAWACRALGWPQEASRTLARAGMGDAS